VLKIKDSRYLFFYSRSELKESQSKVRQESELFVDQLDVTETLYRLKKLLRKILNRIFRYEKNKNYFIVCDDHRYSHYNG